MDQKKCIWQCSAFIQKGSDQIHAQHPIKKQIVPNALLCRTEDT